MKRSQAAEEGFAQANRYYLLMWVVVTVVFVTAFIEYRSYQKEWAATQATISSNRTLEIEAARATTALRSALYGTPGFENEGAALRDIRSHYSAAWKRLVDVRARVSAAEMSTADKAEATSAIYYLIALMLYNDVGPSLGVAPIPDHPVLQLTEFEIGTLRAGSSVEELRVQDAARFLWLSSLDLPALEAGLAKVKALTENPGSGAPIVQELSILKASSADPRQRARAQEVWDSWLAAFKNKAGTTAELEIENRRRESLTLGDPGREILEAYQKQVELEARASGETSKVSLPIVSVPLRLSDAVLILPAALLFCVVAIAIYTRRGLRYAPAEPESGEVVGSIPVYYAAYGVTTRWLGQLIAALLLFLPIAITAVLPLLSAVAPTDWRGWLWLYYGALLAAGIICGALVVQSRRVFDLIDRGIAVKAAKS
jgi:hypothetical protein